VEFAKVDKNQHAEEQPLPSNLTQDQMIDQESSLYNYFGVQNTDQPRLKNFFSKSYKETFDFPKFEDELRNQEMQKMSQVMQRSTWT